MSVCAWNGPPVETPPRTWRRQSVLRDPELVRRNTSTDVEKTLAKMLQVHIHLKHLHGRGEDNVVPRSVYWIVETPPRTWRRPPATDLYIRKNGNTSTDVEKTMKTKRHRTPSWKHLHGRGEDIQVLLQCNLHQETPPRTWRRQGGTAKARSPDGNTSTDVEKTSSVSRTYQRSEKHLHGRGEDDRTNPPRSARLETPPRTWRRPSGALRPSAWLGNTSTDVEKTSMPDSAASFTWKHLHGRGEDQSNVTES